MEDLSSIAEPLRLPIEIPIRPDLFDHRFEDRPVFPAVEAMELLAGAVRRFRGEADLDTLVDVRFDKFLPLPEDAKRLSVVCHLQTEQSSGIRAEMRSRVRLRSGFSRNKVHAAAVFVQNAGADPEPGSDPNPPPGSGFQVSARRLYRELVPFGPAFQTLAGTVSLFEREARATARCPRRRPVPGRLLGNGFVLDGGFHAACAWGQRFAGIVAFPVGIDRRQVLRPTRRGRGYAVRAVPIRSDAEVLFFTLEVRDDAGRLAERLEGLQMRDVSGGRWKPPEWIAAAGSR